jgi:hypothetical protein
VKQFGAQRERTSDECHQYAKHTPELTGVHPTDEFRILVLASRIENVARRCKKWSCLHVAEDR